MKDLNKLDIVYILGNGSRWGNKEIKYSLRSVEKNLPHRKVFVIGEKLDWFNNIEYIPAEDPTSEKLKNALHKLKIACNDDRISDDFILMNDDFFILKPLKDIIYYYKRTLRESLAAHHTKSGYYYDAIKDTALLLKGHNIDNAKDYSMHYPYIYNKQKLLEVIELVEKKNKQLLLRTIYGNLNKVGGEQRNDVKFRNKMDVYNDKMYQSDVISTADVVVGFPKLSSFIFQKFPKKSKYEKE